jgi:ACS family tartrate transporter-like MFS transporter
VNAGLLFLGYGVGMLPSNLILERVGAPIWLGFLVIMWGISSGMMAAVRSAASFYIVRVRCPLF